MKIHQRWFDWGNYYHVKFNIERVLSPIMKIMMH